MTLLVIVTALGCAIIGGVFYAFSTFVMRALARRPVAEAVAAMQAINVAVIHPLFLGPFLGTAVLAVVVLALKFARPSVEGRIDLVVAGALLYLVGTLSVTMLRNVPLNERLARVEPPSDEARAVWADYLKRWVYWNHVRTVAALLAWGAFILELLRLGASA